MGNQERLQLRKNDLQAHWDLSRQKLSVLERERILETRVEEGLRLDEKIKEIKEQISIFAKELNTVEAELHAQKGTPPAQTEPESFTPQGLSAGTQVINQSSIGVNIGQSHAPVHIHLPDNHQEQKDRPRLPFEPEMIEIPAGLFRMGSNPGEGIPTHETPQHPVQLPTFFISKTPVTNAQYEPFVRQSGHEAPKGWLMRKSPTGKNDHPVTHVSWHDAAAYCTWLQEQSGRAYCLPSEAEWEKAARFNDGRLYPWSNDWLGYCCNYGSDGTSPVNAFPQGASAYGCLDMLGNVREWTTTIWGTGPAKPDFPYPFQQDGRDELHPGAGSVFRIHRGGSFRDSPENLRCAARGFSPENSKVSWCGFRLVLEKK
ncbi:MAG: formylglycine-generating enzyme family protein [Candidatus Electrothrix sp. AR5]|nr:formylglycine-generating enzyme family protein [Candidatus Electrothrix sp. AR5]